MLHVFVLVFALATAVVAAMIAPASQAQQDVMQQVAAAVAQEEGTTSDHIHITGVHKEHGHLSLDFIDDVEDAQSKDWLGKEFKARAAQTNTTIRSFNFSMTNSQPMTVERQEICADNSVEPPLGLYRRYTCHIHPDRTGRRRRRPHPKCPFAIVGIRGVELLRNVVDTVEETVGMPVDNFDFAYVAPSLMHQGFVYGDANGEYDFSSGYYCGQSDTIGLHSYGWVCQDPENLVQAYRPISNETIALDNWVPFQYHLVGRKFNCELLWQAEIAMASKYDSCTHPDTAYSYRTVWRNCHTYVNDVVAKYDELAAGSDH